jgi:predicted nuclease of restriction endonuclease-like (RecB) superfamily
LVYAGSCRTELEFTGTGTTNRHVVLRAFAGQQGPTLRAQRGSSQARRVQTNTKRIARDPVLLEFLGLPNTGKLLESGLEQSLSENLQAFLLELGKGFAFVAVELYSTCRQLIVCCQ